MNPTLSRTYGTRHRAALGITEEYDALAVVVSEERGIISLVEDGEVTEGLDAKGLERALTVALSGSPPNAGRKLRLRQVVVEDPAIPVDYLDRTSSTAPGSSDDDPPELFPEGSARGEIAKRLLTRDTRDA